MDTFFRYPGGKTKLRQAILDAIAAIIQNSGITDFREPFFGGGAVGLEVMEQFPQFDKIWVNDFSPSLSSLWTAIIRHPDELIAKIGQFVPNTEDYARIKADLLAVKSVSGDAESIVHYGFSELAIHQMSYSGLGTKAGGPMGGKHQAAGQDAAIGSRWNPDRLARKIREAHRLFDRVHVYGGCCTSNDFSRVFEGEEQAVIYLDPPYYVKGGELYQNAFADQDHQRLADLLKNTDHKWVLSYDDCPQIMDLYAGWANIQQINVVYTINGSFKKPELLITPRPHPIFSLGQPVVWLTNNIQTAAVTAAA